MRVSSIGQAGTQSGFLRSELATDQCRVNTIQFGRLQRGRVTWTGSEPPRGSGWVRSQALGLRRLRTHPLPRGGSDPVQVTRPK